MGLLEDMMDSLSGADQAVHPHLTDSLVGLIGNEEEPGPGLEGLLAGLQRIGLGGVVASWLGPETNLPVTPDQVREALGNAEVAAMAARAGLPEATVLETLAEHLPGMVDHLSPQGRLLPAGAGATSMI